MFRLTEKELEILSENLRDKRDYFYRLLKNDQTIQLVAKKEEGEVVGIGWAWKNDTHPHATYVKLFLEEVTGSELEQTVKEFITYIEANIDKENSTHLQYSLSSEEKEWVSILKKLGFYLMRKTYEPTISVKRALQAFDQIEAHADVCTLESVLKNEALSKKLFCLTMQVYQESHLDNPVKSHTWQEEKDLYFSYPIDVSLSRVAFSKDGEIESYLFYLKPEDKRIEVGWAGAVSKDKSAALKRLFKHTLVTLNQLGIQEIEPEIDTTDYFQKEVLFSFLGYEDLISWDTYKKSV
jgi:hypothetical protein